MPPNSDPDHQRASRSEPPPALLAGIVASGLAAAVGAVLTSYLGVQGTLVGATLGAMLAAGASQIFRLPLDRLERRLIRAGFSAVRLRRLGLVRGVLSTRGAPGKLWRALPRRAVLGTLGLAAAGLVLGMTGITLLEAAQGRPISAITTGVPRRGTTASNLVPGPSAPAATPETASPAVPTGVAATTAATSQPTPTARAGTPTAAPAAPSPRGVATPTQAAPTPVPLPTGPAPGSTAPAPRTPTAP
jgi:hypothetical protein